MAGGAARPGVARRRWVLGAAAGATVAAGLGVHFLATGAAADFTADALYAVLVYLLLAVVAPRVASAGIAAVAFALCGLVELFQLTGIPSDVAARFPPAALLLGSTFAPVDLVAYAVGIAAITALDLLVRRRLSRAA